MPHREIPLYRERNLLARLALDWFRTGYTFNSEKKQRQNFGAHAEEMHVYLGLIVGTTEGKPMGVTKLAEYVGLPRSTCERKVKLLCDEGVAERSGRGYRIRTDWLAKPEERDKILRIVRLIKETAARLPDLGTKPVD